MIAAEVERLKSLYPGVIFSFNFSFPSPRLVKEVESILPMLLFYIGRIPFFGKMI